MKLTRTLALPLVAALALGACGSDDKSDATTPSTQKIVIGQADFPESQLIAQIYAQSLENSGFRVSLKDPLGSRELYYKAIQANEIQLVPEYTNSLLSYVLRLDKPDALPTSKTIADQVTELKAALPDTLTIGTPSTAEDKDVIVCSKEVADKYLITNLSTLAAASANITIGGPPEFETRSPFGLAGFKDILKAEFKEFVPLKIGQIADSIKSGAIDCGNMFSTMSAITTNGFVALEDDQTLVPAEAVLPLMTTAAATPEVLAVLNAVDAKLTTDVLKQLMVKIEVDATSPDVVAKEFLASLGS